MGIKTKISSSLRELYSVKSIALAGMLLAVTVVVGYFANFSLTVFPLVKVSFSFIPQSLTAMLLGPVVSGAVGGLGDLISFILNGQGGAYFPGWTLNSIITGLIYGVFLYKNNTSLKNIVTAKIIILLFVEILLGTLWLNIQFGWPIAATLTTRAITNTLSAPLEIALMFVVGSTLKRILPHIGQQRKL